jgi:hypothetical protein
MPRGVYIRTKENIKNMSNAHMGIKSPMKGKKLEEIVGITRAIEIKNLSKQANLGKKLSRKTKNKISSTLKGRVSPNKGNIYSQESLEKMRQGQLGKKLNKKHKQKIAESVKKNWHTFHTKESIEKAALKTKGIKRGPRTKEIRIKLRKAMLKNISKNYDIFYPAYNKKACEFFKSFDEQNNTKGHYAVYGGGEHYIKELGYWIDYINFDKKLIIEIDEKHHFEKGVLKEKDIIRQKEIQECFPNFKFIRFTDKELKTPEQLYDFLIKNMGKQ